MDAFFWPWMLQQDVDRLQRRDSRVQAKADRTQEGLRDLEAQLERLNLACAAMWSLLRQHGHTDEALLAAMEALDLRDGKADGRLGPEPLVCGNCKRKSSPRHAACLYCGTALPRPGPFGAA